MESKVVVDGWGQNRNFRRWEQKIKTCYNLADIQKKKNQ